MKVFGFEIRKALSAVQPLRDGWRRIVESFPGAWQQNKEEARGDIVTYPTLYACLFRISSDIGKLPYMLVTDSGGISLPTTNPAYSPVLSKPNLYQTQAQFREQWMLSKLMNGNTYVLKLRDDRRVVVGMFILDPERVLPMVSDSGEVYYQISSQNVSGRWPLPGGYPAKQLIVPASEVIHDRCMTIHHPLIGVPPLCAANWPAVKNMKIMRSATEFFANNAQPGGLLTAPAGMSEDDAQKVKDYWATQFTGANSGRVAVIGADMKFTPFAMKSIDAQMIEQMRYGDEQICQPFGMPPFKVGIGTLPSGLGVDGLNQLYYADALQTHIEHMEGLLNEGLRISSPLSVELNLEPLLRMDEGKRADVATKLVGGAIETPNEARRRFNHAPLLGGDTVYMQQQDYPLDQVRLNKIEPPAPPPEPEDEPADDEEPTIEEAKAIIATNLAIKAMRQRMEAVHV